MRKKPHLTRIADWRFVKNLTLTKIEKNQRSSKVLVDLAMLPTTYSMDLCTA
jgi:hypothetical protein